MFTAPTMMVPSVTVAKKIVDNAIESHDSYHRTITNHLKHLQLAPPFDPKKLRASAQSWRSNFSFGKATGKVEKLTIEAVGTAYGALGMAFLRFKRFNEKEYGEKEDKQWMRDDVKRGQYANDIVSVYADLFEDDDRTPDLVSRVSYNMRTFGVGYVLKEPGREKDWLGEAFDIRSVMFPKRSRVTDIDKAVVKSSMPILKFWQKYTSMKPGSAWNKEGLEELFFHYYKEHGSKGKELNSIHDTAATKGWEDVSNSFAEEVTLLDQCSDSVSFSKILSEEPDGSITVTYYAYTGDTETSIKDFSPKFLLYQKNFKGIKVKDILFIVRDSGVTSSGFIQDMRGISQFAVPDSHRFNLDRNALRDKALLSGNMTFAQSTANQGQKFNLTVSSVATITPQGFEASDKQHNPNLGPLFDSMRAEEEAYQRETQHHDASISGRLGDRATTREVDRVAAEVEGARQSKVAVSLRDWARIHMSNIMDLAKNSFKDSDPGKDARDYFFDELSHLWQLPEEGVQSILDEISRISLEVVQANPDALRESIAITQSQYARNELSRQLLTVLGHPRRRVERLNPRTGKQDSVTADQIHAELQNQIFWTRGGVLIGDNVDPVVQLRIHFKLFKDAVDSVQRGGDPVAIANYLKNGLGHTAKLLLLTEEDPLYKPSFDELKLVQDQFEQQLKQIVAAAKKKAKQIAAEREAKEGQLDPETERRLRIEEFEAGEKNKRNAENRDATQKLKEEAQAASQDLKRQSTEADIALKTAMTTAEIANQNRKAESSEQSDRGR
jgi:hypothetical protein